VDVDLEVVYGELHVSPVLGRAAFFASLAGAALHAVHHRLHDVDVERVAEDPRAGLVGPRRGDAVARRVVLARQALAQHVVDVGQRRRTDLSNRARREIAIAQQAGLSEAGLEITQQNEGLHCRIAQHLPQILGRDLLEVPALQVLHHLL